MVSKCVFTHTHARARERADMHATNIEEQTNKANAGEIRFYCDHHGNVNACFAHKILFDQHKYTNATYYVRDCCWCALHPNGTPYCVCVCVCVGACDADH